MVKEKFKLIKDEIYAKATSIRIKGYIRRCLDIYAYNEKVSRSEVMNRLLQDFLIKEGYMDREGNVIRERIY